MDKQIVDIGKELLDDMTDDEKKEKEKKNEDFEGLRTWMTKVLDGKIIRVEVIQLFVVIQSISQWFYDTNVTFSFTPDLLIQVSTRLVDSPATLVQSEYGVSPNMQKYLRAQAVVDAEDKGEFANIFNQAVLEINPSHPIVTKLKAMHESDPEGADSIDLVNLVFNTAALAAGYMLENSAEYSKMVIRMMTKLAN